MKCPECGTESRPGTRFCRQCGEMLSDAEPAAPQPPPKNYGQPAAPTTPIGVSMPSFSPPPNSNPSDFSTVAMRAPTAVTPPPNSNPSDFSTVAMKAPTAVTPPPNSSPSDFSTVAMKAPAAVTAPPQATLAMGVPSPAANVSQNRPAQTVSLNPPPTQSMSGPLADPTAPRTGGFSPSMIIAAVVGAIILLGIVAVVTFFLLGGRSMGATTLRQTSSAAANGGAEILDGSIFTLELCPLESPPTSDLDFDESRIGTNFSEGVRTVFLRVKGASLPDSRLKIVWSRDGEVAFAQAMKELRPETFAFLPLYQRDGGALPKGSYTAEIRDHERPVGRISFTIK
jgi:hypothetical protein